MQARREAEANIAVVQEGRKAAVEDAAEVIQLYAEITDLKQQLVSAYDEISSLQHSLGLCDDDTCTEEGEVWMEREAEVEELRQHLEASQTERDAHQTVLGAREGEIVDLKRVLGQVEADRNRLGIQNTVAVAAETALRNELRTVTHRCEEAMRQREEAEAAAKALAGDIRRSRQGCEEAQIERDTSERAKMVLEGELLGLTRQLEAAHMEITAVKTDSTACEEQMSEEIETLRDRLLSATKTHADELKTLELALSDAEGHYHTMTITWLI